MDKIKWEFAKTGGGDVTGLNDPVTAVFKGRGDFSYHLARESIQNVIDAHNPKVSEPAKASISLMELQPSDFPAFDQLKEVLELCRDVDRQDKDSYNFYQTAVTKILKNGFISILKISDYNTTGLTGGDDEEKGAYFSFMKAVGSSSKSGPAGGSFGLGKGAYFKASSFRTIFVSSKCESAQVVFQGKARIRSFKKDGEMMQGNGTFGLTGQKPIRKDSLIPSLFRRDELGTDIYIVGYEIKEDWKDVMTKSILDNFWCAIAKGDLEVSLDGINISSDSLEELLTRNFDERRPDKKGDSNPWPYYRAYINGEILEEKFPVLGQVKLYLLAGDNYPSRISYIRKTGMVIQKKGQSATSSYAGVFLCENDKGNEILKKMENPSHDEWNSDNAQESHFATEAQEAEKEMHSFIRNSINNFFASSNTESLNVGGLEEFLWLEGDLGVGGVFGQELSKNISKTETGTEIGKEINESGNRLIERKLDVLKEVKIGSPGGPDYILGKGKKTKRGGGHEDEEGENEIIILKQLKFRSFALKGSEGKIKHVITIKGPVGTNCSLELQAGTDDSFEKVMIKKAYDEDNNYKVSGNQIYGIKIDPSGKERLEVLFDDNERYSLNITAYETK